MTPNTQITPETVGINWPELKRLGYSIEKTACLGRWASQWDARLKSVGRLSSHETKSGALRACRDHCDTNRPAASSPSAVGVGHLTAAERAYGEDRAASMLNTYPTPAPAPSADHIADAGKMAVDWQVVGPKLVEENEHLTAMLRNVVAHATGGSIINGETISLNEICCRITKMRNSIYTAGKDAATPAQPDTGAVEALERIATLHMKRRTSEGQYCRDIANEALAALSKPNAQGREG